MLMTGLPCEVLVFWYVSNLYKNNYLSCMVLIHLPQGHFSWTIDINKTDNFSKYRQLGEVMIYVIGAAVQESCIKM